MNPPSKDKHDGERKRKADDGSCMDSPEEKPSPTRKGDSNGNGLSARRVSGRRHLKPLFEVGAAVTAAWWPDPLSKRNDVPSSWLPGVVRSHRYIAAAGPYGPTRSYDIEYGDGDELNDVAEHLIFTKEDYDLTMQNDGKSDWIGVRNVVDHAAHDLWAQIAGWYIATIDGEERPFSLLADAMDAYDASVVAKRKSKEIKPSDLNRPEKYARLFEQNSPSEGGGSTAEGRSERKKKKKKKRKRKSSSKNSQPDLKRPQLQADGTPPSIKSTGVKEWKVDHVAYIATLLRCRHYTIATVPKKAMSCLVR